MDNVFLRYHAVISSNCTRVPVESVRGSDQFASSGNYVVTFPNHGKDWTTASKVDQSSKEWSSLVLLVVLLKQLSARLSELHGNQLKSALLKLLQNITEALSLHAIRLDHNERFLFSRRSYCLKILGTSL